jgi:hypothetical protein
VVVVVGGGAGAVVVVIVVSGGGGGNVVVVVSGGGGGMVVNVVVVWGVLFTVVVVEVVGAPLTVVVVFTVVVKGAVVTFDAEVFAVVVVDLTRSFLAGTAVVPAGTEALVVVVGAGGRFTGMGGPVVVVTSSWLCCPAVVRGVVCRTLSAAMAPGLSRKATKPMAAPDVARTTTKASISALLRPPAGYLFDIGRRFLPCPDAPLRPTRPHRIAVANCSNAASLEACYSAPYETAPGVSEGHRLPTSRAPHIDRPAPTNRGQSE